MVQSGGVSLASCARCSEKETFVSPDVSSDGPDLPTLSGVRITTMRCEDGRSEVVHDDWMVENSVHVHSLNAWVGSSVFITIAPEAKPEPPESLQMGGKGEEDFVSSRPWMGDRPPESMFVGCDVFELNKDCARCRRGAQNRL